jgi:hypothetical protein
MARWACPPHRQVGGGLRVPTPEREQCLDGHIFGVHLARAWSCMGLPAPRGNGYFHLTSESRFSQFFFVGFVNSSAFIPPLMPVLDQNATHRESASHFQL